MTIKHICFINVNQKRNQYYKYQNQNEFKRYISLRKSENEFLKEIPKPEDLTFGKIY